jgi:hypothetical protein
MLVETDSSIKSTIYISLLEEGTVVFRPTQGVALDTDIFEVLPTDDYDPEDEVWQFPPGTVVRCEKQKRDGEEILIAVAEHSVIPA